MAERTRASTSSEEEDFCRISDGGQSDLEDDAKVGGKGDSPEEKHTLENVPQISEYCQVVFQNVSESYKPGKPLECYYTLSSVLVPSQRDYVAVFKVGWNSIRSYVTFEYAPYPKDWKPNQEFKQCILFGKNYIPREEDGEFYQFCYIDSSGKMRGASTPFQFLETPMEDFMEISDESIDFLMIQTKKSHNSELVVQLTAERDNIASEKAQIEKEKNQLVGKVEELEAALSVKEEEVREFSEKVENAKEIINGIPVLEGKLAATNKELSELQAEKLRYEESLQQTTEAFMEIQNNIAQLEEERRELKKELQDLIKERDEFKSEFASSEKENETLRNEIDNLKKQLMEVNEQNQIILAKEGAIKEEKQKVEQQLLVASSDKDHKMKLEAQVKQLEDVVQKSVERNSKLEEQLKAMSDFHGKLTKDYEQSRIECDDLKSKISRQADDFLQKQKRMEQHVSLVQHKEMEKRSLLEEHVEALKQGMTKLAKEKENLVAGNMGSEEASHIAVKSFKDKVIKATRKAEEESYKKVQLQKELLEVKETFQMEKSNYEAQMEYYQKRLKDCEEDAEQKAKDAGKEINSLRVRLEMAREEYKILYREVRCSENSNLTESMSKVKLQESPPVDQHVEMPLQRETESAQLATPPKDDYESRDMTLNMEEMNRQLSRLTRELERRKEKIQQYQAKYEDERMKREEAENLYREMQETKRHNEEELRNKLKDKRVEIATWRERFNKVMDDYLKTKHACESAQYDRDLTRTAKKNGGMTQPSPKDKSDSPRIIVPRYPPPLEHPNPYKSDNSQESTVYMISPPGKYPASVTTGTLSCMQSIDIKNPPGNLPEPLSPQQTPQAKVVAVRASLQAKHNNGKEPSAPPLGPEEDDEDMYGAGPVEDEGIGSALPTDVESDGAVRNGEDRPPSPVFHDAQEYPADSKVCPHCNMVFSPQTSDEELAQHMQFHFVYHCKVCDRLMDKDTTTQEDYQRHLESHAHDANLQKFCPICNKVLDVTPEQLEHHVNSHLTD